MSLEIKFRWRGTCPRHPKFNPQRQNAAMIRGNCEHCHALLAVHQLHSRLETVPVYREMEQRMRAFEESADPEGRCRG